MDTAKCVAVVPVFDNLPFDWVAGRKMISELLQELDQIRDLDEIFVVATDPDSVKSEIPDGLDLEPRIVKLPTSLTTPMDILRWVDKNYDHDAVLAFVDPLFPFLPASKIQHAFYQVLGGMSSAFTVQRRCHVDGIRMVAGSSVVEACIVVTSDTIKKHCADGYFVGNYTGVAVNQIEALDYRLEDGQRTIHALELM